MAGEWKETTLGECAAWLSGGTPFKGNEAFWSGTIPWVSAKDMKSFRLHDAEDHISPLAVGNGGKLVPAGTILLLVRGMTLHNDVPICMVTREMAFNQDIKALRPAKNVDGAFLAYWLLANKPDLLATVDHAGHGTGRLVTDTLKEKPVQLPPLAEQKAIAAVLGALDDKIELNRRMNATLEAMARALFQSWFVDFDPVRAKLDGSKPVGLDDATAAFFPATFQDSPLGHIPKGWEVRPLADAFDIKDGATFRKEDRLETGSIIAFGANGPVGFSTRANVTEPCIALGKIGSCGSLHRSWNPCWVTNNAFIVKPPRGGSLEFLWRTLCTIEFSQFIGGSANPYMPLKNFGHTPVVMPPETLLNAYQERAGSLATKIVANDEQSRTLATLRDTLLPKLLSGELSVAGNESLAEAATNL